MQTSSQVSKARFLPCTLFGRIKEGSFLKLLHLRESLLSPWSHQLDVRRFYCGFKGFSDILLSAELKWCLSEGEHEL